LFNNIYLEEGIMPTLTDLLFMPEDALVVILLDKGEEHA